MKTRVALGCAAVLGLGALLAPRGAPTPLPASQERAAPLLEEEVQRREPARLFAGVQQAARTVAPYGIALPPVEERRPSTVADVAAGPQPASLPAGFGVRVTADGHVLTHAAALAGRTILDVERADGVAAQAQLVAYEPETRLALLRIGPAEGPVAPLAPEPPSVGTLAVAVGWWNGREVVTPLLVSTPGEREYAISVFASAVPPGTPIYNFNGELLAVATDQPGQALPAPAAVERLTARAAAGRGDPAALGVRFQAIDSVLARVAGERGVLVAELTDGGPAAAAGVQAGDVLLAVGETAVDSPEEAQAAIAALEPGREVTLHIVRAGRRQEIGVAAGSAFTLAARGGPPTSAGDALPRIRDLFTDDQIGAAAIPGDARVISVNGRTIATRAAAAREARRARGSLLLHLEHEGERYFALADGQP